MDFLKLNQEQKRIGAIAAAALVLVVIGFSLGKRSRRAELTPRLMPPPVTHPGFRRPVPVEKKSLLMVQDERDRETASGTVSKKEPKPYKTFIHIQRYQITNNGEKNQPISNVKIDVNFSIEVMKENGKKERVTVMEFELPGNQEYWPIGNGQVQDIDRTFELPWKYIENDSFKFRIQMVRKGSWMKPCEFEVYQLSEFNRSYVCRTDLDWQRDKGVKEERLDDESLQVRVFTDLRHTPRKQIPKNAIAIR